MNPLADLPEPAIEEIVRHLSMRNATKFIKSITHAPQSKNGGRVGTSSVRAVRKKAARSIKKAAGLVVEHGETAKRRAFALLEDKNPPVSTQKEASVLKLLGTTYFRTTLATYYNDILQTLREQERTAKINIHVAAIDFMFDRTGGTDTTEMELFVYYTAAGVKKTAEYNIQINGAWLRLDHIYTYIGFHHMRGMRYVLLPDGRLKKFQ